MKFVTFEDLEGDSYTTSLANILLEKYVASSVENKITYGYEIKVLDKSIKISSTTYDKILYRMELVGLMN